MDRNIHPILVVDNEENNISDLKELLDRSGREARPDSCITQYVESMADTVEAMADSMSEGRTYSAVICDLHFDRDKVDGDDFIRVIRGNLVYALSKDQALSAMDATKFGTFDHLKEFVKRKSMRYNRDVEYFFEENFDFDEYRNFVSYFNRSQYRIENFMFLSGRPQEADLTCLDDMPLFRKVDGFEQDVLDHLTEKGIFGTDHVSRAVNDHWRLSPAVPEHKRKYNPSSSHIKKAAKKLKKQAREAIGRKYKK